MNLDIPRMALKRAEEMAEDPRHDQIATYSDSGKILWNVLHSLQDVSVADPAYWPHFSHEEKILLLCFLAAAWKDLK